MPRLISKQRKFVADGVFYAELNELLTRMIGAEGYTGVEIRRTSAKTSITINAVNSLAIAGDKGRRMREITALIQSRWGLKDVEVFAANVRNRAFSAIAQAEAIHFKLSKGVPVRRACNGVIRQVMENQAPGCEIIISGKVRAARAKAMKFREGYMVKSGTNAAAYIDEAVRHLKLKQGVCGIKVRIMKPQKVGDRVIVNVKKADVVTIREPKVAH